MDISVLSAYEQLEVSLSMKEIVSEEKLLQEVVISWIDDKVPVLEAVRVYENKQLNFILDLEHMMKLVDTIHSTVFVFGMTLLEKIYKKFWLSCIK